MFYDRFVGLCKERGVSPSAVMVSIGLNKSNATFWKKGSIPKGDTLQKLADYFDVSVDYLLGKTDFPFPDRTGRTETFRPWTRIDQELFDLGGFEALVEFEFLSKEDKAEALKDINKFVEFTLSKYKTKKQSTATPQSTLSSTEGSSTTPPPDVPGRPTEGK